MTGEKHGWQVKGGGGGGGETDERAEGNETGER